MHSVWNVTTMGRCPICREDWWADPQAHCTCTRPRPGDAEAEQRALAKAAKARASVLAYHARQDAIRRMPARKVTVR
jgi:hypothetical protein